MEVIVSQRSVQLRRTQRGKALTNFLHAQSLFPPPRHTMDTNAVSPDMRFSSDYARDTDNH